MRLLVAVVLVVAACSKSEPARETPPQAAAPAVTAKAVEATSPLGRITHPRDNATSPAKVALGHQLYFDKRLSGDGTRSCYSCHVNEKGLTDGLPVAIGAFEKKLTRSSPSMWNIGFHDTYYWDGRAPSLEAQGLAAWKGGNMGTADVDAKAREIAAIEGYRTQFQAVFGGEPTPERIIQAISSYERTIVCDDTPFDRWLAGNQDAMNEQQKRGFATFGKAGCIACHTPPLFTDRQFHNTGIGMDKPEPDVGRFKVSQQERDRGAFKTPSLRDITKSAPYFHDGSVATLEEAVKFMASGGHANPQLDPLLRETKLSEADVKDLVAFLGALDCPKGLDAPTLP